MPFLFPPAILAWISFNIQSQALQTCILPFILRKMSPSTLFPGPQKEEESVTLTPSPVFQSVALMPGCSGIITLSRPCSLLPGSQEKPFLKLARDTSAKSALGSLQRSQNRPSLPAPSCSATLSVCSELKSQGWQAQSRPRRLGLILSLSNTEGVTRFRWLSRVVYELYDLG